MPRSPAPSAPAVVPAVSLALALALALSLLPAGPAAAQAARRGPSDSSATWLASAIDRIGGDSALRAITAVRYRYQTLWFRPTWDRTISGLVPFGSAEENVDLRDYRANAWRMERRFGIEPGPPAIVNIIRDSVASTAIRGTLAPQNGAYVDERDELFLAAPERLLQRLAADPRDASLRALPDTVLAGRIHHVLAAELDGRSVRLWVSRDGFLRGVGYRAAQPRDFGLAGLGTMEVAVYYDQWREAGGVALPWQITIFRAGELYKQLLLRAAEVNPAHAAESLMVVDSIRQRFVAAGRKAMYDLPHDSLVTAVEGIVTFAGVGVHPGAVRLRQGWMMVTAGPADLTAERARAALERRGAPVKAVLLMSTSPTAIGGSRALAEAGITFVLPSGSVRAARTMLGDLESKARPFTIIAGGSWITVAGDSVWAEELEVPDAVGAVLFWVPRLKWAYLGPVGSPWHVRQALRVLDARGFAPQMVGLAQGIATPIAAVRARAAAPR